MVRYSIKLESISEVEEEHKESEESGKDQNFPIGELPTGGPSFTIQKESFVKVKQRKKATKGSLLLQSKPSSKIQAE